MKKSYLAVLAILAVINVLHGQALKQDLVLGAYTSGQTNIQALRSITLTNGFQIPVGASVTISIAFSFPALVSKPTIGQNYTLVRSFRDSIKSDQLNSPFTIGQASQQINYYDGLGRPTQMIQLMASPTYKDIVQLIEYDGFGRNEIQYLPYADSVGNGSFRAAAKTTQSTFYKDGGWGDVTVVKTDYPYSVSVFENSPANRILQQGAPGTMWQPLANRDLVTGSATSGRTVATAYGSNGSNDVKLWTINTADNGASATYYTAGKLFKTVVKDENWIKTDGKAGTTEEYRDAENRVVLKRVWETDSKELETHYIYDYAGDLRYVVPPSVTAMSFTEASNDLNFNRYIYSYRYDRRRRVVAKKIPGKGKEYLIYNKRNLVVLTQDSLQRSRKEWVYYRYNALGKITSSGIYSNTVVTTPKGMQGLVDGHSGPLWEGRDGADYPAPATTFPVAGTGVTIKPLIVNYYDDYNFSGAATLLATGIVQSKRTHSRLTATRIYKTDGSSPLMTINYYDDNGRVIQSLSQNQLSGTDRVTNTYLFSGELKTSLREHKASATAAPVKILTTNEYDHVGRLVETKKQMGTLAEISQSKLSYNEIGQLKQKNLHNVGSTSVQEIVYAYNERGWLKSLNNPTAVGAKRVFGMELTYGDKTNTYNGNIGIMKWNTQVSSVMTMQPVQTYTYYYDKLNRLKRGFYNNATDTKSGYFDEELTYDVMGNIDTLRRRNGTGTGWYNHFKYTYTGNQLAKVTDGGTAARTNTFTYDVNGNGITNSRLGISNIDYNHLNLPIKLTKGTENLVYSYDGLGKKVTKTLGSAVTQYVDGIQYENGVLKFIQTEEGRILPNGSSYIYEYFLKDHLGNTRAVVDQSGTIKQIQDYYPFGMEMNQGNALNTASNLYKYNGKEKQVELGLDQLDYGARFYDAEIGRFNVIDRFAEKYTSFSPYQYGGLDPIKHIDVNGDSLYITHRTGFLGLGKKQTLRYEGGGLYNQDGSAYTGRISGFLKRTVDALGSIMSTREGGTMISALESSTNAFTIIKSSGSRFVRDESRNLQAFSNQLQTDPAQGSVLQSLQRQGINLSGGAGGVIEWNSSGVLVPTLNGAMKNGITDLAHEMFHGLDANRGLLDDRIELGVKRDEWQAVYRENMVRQQMGLPLRTHYIKNVNSDGTFIGGAGPRLLTPGNHPLRPKWYTP